MRGREGREKRKGKGEKEDLRAFPSSKFVTTRLYLHFIDDERNAKSHHMTLCMLTGAVMRLR